MNWKLLSLAALGFVLIGCDGKKEEKKEGEAKPAEVAPVAPVEEPKADEAKPAEVAPVAPSETPVPEGKKPE